MWIKRTEYISLCERLARLEAAENARQSELLRSKTALQNTDAAADARRLAVQSENLLAYDGTAQTGGQTDAEE